jgi:hypothetical protein
MERVRQMVAVSFLIGKSLVGFEWVGRFSIPHLLNGI